MLMPGRPSRRGLWLYSYIGGGLSGNPVIAAGFAMAAAASRIPAPPHARPRFTSRTRGHQRGNQLPGDATSSVTGPWRTAREPEIKRLMAVPRSTASSPYPAFPRHSHRSTPNASKNKALRNRAFRVVVNTP
jgi:hypothetical protein